MGAGGGSMLASLLALSPQRGACAARQGRCKRRCKRGSEPEVGSSGGVWCGHRTRGRGAVGAGGGRWRIVGATCSGLRGTARKRLLHPLLVARQQLVQLSLRPTGQRPVRQAVRMLEVSEDGLPLTLPVRVPRPHRVAVTLGAVDQVVGEGHRLQLDERREHALHERQRRCPAVTNAELMQLRLQTLRHASARLQNSESSDGEACLLQSSVKVASDIEHLLRHAHERKRGIPDRLLPVNLKKTPAVGQRASLSSGGWCACV